MTLVNKLKDVKVGDVVRIFNEEGITVVGYALKVSDKKIRLGHEDGSSRDILAYSMAPTVRGSRIFSGDRTYNLNDFDDYEILQSRQKA